MDQEIDRNSQTSISDLLQRWMEIQCFVLFAKIEQSVKAYELERTKKRTELFMSFFNVVAVYDLRQIIHRSSTQNEINSTFVRMGGTTGLKKLQVQSVYRTT